MARRTLLLTVVAALAGPAAASAHGGKSAPVATNFRTDASIAPRTAGLHVRVADGDRILWLHASGAAVVTVLGAEREPFLRFDRQGVSVNLRAPTAQIDGITPPNAPVRADSNAPPRWHQVSGGRTYRWHDHRLHALEPLARGRSARALGHWVIPMLVDGRRVSIGGELRYAPAPSPWPWVAAIVLVAAGGTLGLREARRRAIVTTGLALLATVAIAIARIGRELYGWPLVDGLRYAAIVVTCIVGALLVYGLTLRDREIRLFVAFLVGFGSLYQGLTFLPMLTQALPLTVLPTAVARACVAMILGIGSAAVALSALEQGGDHSLSRRRVRTTPPRRQRIHPLPKQR